MSEYRARSSRIVAWARAAFEQDALPSLLLLQGLVPIFTRGDKMFQSTSAHQGRQRPFIIHAYDGAKVGMANALRSVTNEGWVPLAVKSLELGVASGSHAGKSGTTNQFGRVPSTRGLLESTLSVTLIVKTPPTSGDPVLTALRRCNCWRKVALGSCPRQICKTNRRWRL